MQIKYRDTWAYSPVDVVKGIDLITQQIVAADDLAPSHYPVRPKCQNCRNFDAAGICLADAGRPMAYADMMATTCEDYGAHL